LSSAPRACETRKGRASRPGASCAIATPSTMNRHTGHRVNLRIAPPPQRTISCVRPVGASYSGLSPCTNTAALGPIASCSIVLRAPRLIDALRSSYFVSRVDRTMRRFVSLDAGLRPHSSRSSFSREGTFASRCNASRDVQRQREEEPQAGRSSAYASPNSEHLQQPFARELRAGQRTAGSRTQRRPSSVRLRCQHELRITVS
jgi:hypothetical protein